MNVSFNLSLAPFDESMSAQARLWRNEWRIWKFCRQTDVISDVEQEAWFRRQAADQTIKMYGVKMTVEGMETLIGVAGFTDISHFHHRAEFSLYLNPAQHGKGLGGEALKVLLQHGFINLGFGKIWGETFASNPASSLFLKLGFRLEGTRRAHYYKDGAFHDAHLYSILRDEWETSVRPSSPLPSPSPSPETSCLDLPLQEEGQTLRALSRGEQE